MLAAAVGATLMCSAAHATIAFVGLTPVPIDPATGALDPASGGDANLANYKSFDLVVSISPDDHWAGASILGTLNHGTFYVPPKNDADTGISAVADFRPNLNYDTFLSRPGYVDPGSGAILGSASGVAGFTMPKSSNTKNAIDVAWGDVNATTNPLTGVQAIARLTVSNDAPVGAQGVFTGTLKSTSNPNAANPFTFTFAPIPEPTSIALMGLGLGAVALRRRK